jgi:hypothetical protein
MSRFMTTRQRRVAIMFHSLITLFELLHKSDKTTKIALVDELRAYYEVVQARSPTHVGKLNVIQSLLMALSEDTAGQDEFHN